MKNLKIKVTEGCNGNLWWVSLYDGKKELMISTGRTSVTCWERKFAAIRNAQAIAKRIGIPYDPEIVKQHGC